MLSLSTKYFIKNRLSYKGSSNYAYQEDIYESGKYNRLILSKEFNSHDHVYPNSVIRDQKF